MTTTSFIHFVYSDFRQLHQSSEFGLNPQLRDPYESKMIEVQSSGIEGASEGLFALKDIEINTVVAFYNGTKPDPDDYDPDTWETNNYKIFDPADMPDGTIDIPVWAQVSKTIKIFYLVLNIVLQVIICLLCNFGSQDQS